MIKKCQQSQLENHELNEELHNNKNNNQVQYKQLKISFP